MNKQPLIARIARLGVAAWLLVPQEMPFVDYMEERKRPRGGLINWEKYYEENE